MKRLNILFLSLFTIATVTHAQIYIDNQGNVIDQTNTLNNNRNTSSAKPKVASQPKASSFDKRKLEFGGALGLQFGNYTTINVSPQVGYGFSKYLSAGVGIGYTYFKEDRNNFDISEHFASFNLYGNFYPVEFIVVSVRPEISRMWQNIEYNRTSTSYSKFVPSVVLGAGVRFGPLMAQIKYDVVQDDYSPYGNNIFYSIGYTFGF